MTASGIKAVWSNYRFFGVLGGASPSSPPREGPCPKGQPGWHGILFRLFCVFKPCSKVGKSGVFTLEPTEGHRGEGGSLLSPLG